MKTVLIDYSGFIVQTALLENGRLIEVIADDKNNSSLLGNIYAGVIKAITPDQFAFIDIGQGKNAFLNLADNKEGLLFDDDGRLSIKPGKHLVVQVVKEESGSKGPSVTSQVSLSENGVVLYKSAAAEIGVSRKIENTLERSRLKRLAERFLPDGYGIILRTSCQNRDEETISADIITLADKLEGIFDKAKYLKAPALAYKEEYFLSLTLKTILSQDVDRIVLNDENELNSVKSLAEDILGKAPDVFLQEGSDLFAEYFVKSQLEKALNKKVWLPSGGFIVIEQAEAAVVIDVNSGKFKGKKTQQKTAYKINCEAAEEIALQIRLRNLSGMILIDFIDLHNAEARENLMKSFKTQLKNDRIPVNIAEMSSTGLVQLTRKKTREPLLDSLTTECPCCHGSGRRPK